MCMSIERIEIILGKNCLLIFWVPLFLRPKAATDVKKQPVLGPDSCGGKQRAHFKITDQSI